MMKNLYKIVLLLCSIFTVGTNTSTAQSLQADSIALVDLYNLCGGANWDGHDTWLNGPLSTWEGVTVDETLQRVTHVNFKPMNLVGTLPASLGNMDEMSGKIELHDDIGMTGELPAVIWKWTKVERFQLKRSGITSIDLTGIENMVNLTEYNTEKNNISGEAPASVFALPSMVKVYLHDCNYDEAPAGITAATGKLDRLYFNGNGLTALPDLGAMTWKEGAKVRFHNNALTFEDLEPIVRFLEDPNVEELRYSPQAAIGTETYLYPDAGGTVNLDGTIGGSANIYTWIKGTDEAVGDAGTLTIDAFDAATNSGRYFAIVQSELVPGLDILVAPQKLFASVQAQDSLALAALYNANGGAQWTGYETWLNGPISAWEGVTIDSASQRVVNVNFKDMNIVGTLAQDIEDITEMSGKVEFRDDSLMTGEFPAFIWKWTQLERFQLKFSGITSVDLTGIENMVNLTEYNTEGNAIGGTVPGVVLTLPSMVKTYFHDCEYDALPGELLSANGLDRFYVNGDNLTELPDMTAIVWGEGAKVRVHNNNLTFEDLEGNIVLTGDPLVEEFRYSPQANVGESTTIEVATGDPVTMELEVGGTANIYTWVRGADQVVGGAETFTIASATPGDAGDYRLLIQNELVPGLDILSEPFQLFVDGTTSTFDVNFGEINVLGNPMTHTLNIQADKKIDRVMIHSIAGQQFRNQVVNNQQINLPVSGLTPGLYLVTLQAEGQFYTLKVVKE